RAEAAVVPRLVLVERRPDACCAEAAAGRLPRPRVARVPSWPWPGLRRPLWLVDPPIPRVWPRTKTIIASRPTSMSAREFVHSPAAPLPDRLKQYLTATARRELDALRAALDSRLLALEAALAHPEPHDSLETFVMDLARVATAEAEASAARASLEAQI